MDTSQVIKSFFDTIWLAEQVAIKYNLSNIRFQLIKATMRDVYHVRTSNNNAIFILYPAKRTESQIASEVRLTRYLTKQSFPTITPHLTRNDEEMITLSAPEGTRYGVLYPYVEGSITRQPTAEIIRRIGKLLATFHQLTDNYSETIDRPTYNLDVLAGQSTQIIG